MSIYIQFFLNNVCLIPPPKGFSEMPSLPYWKIISKRSWHTCNRVNNHRMAEISSNRGEILQFFPILQFRSQKKNLSKIQKSIKTIWDIPSGSFYKHLKTTWLDSTKLKHILASESLWYQSIISSLFIIVSSKSNISLPGAFVWL